MFNKQFALSNDAAFNAIDEFYCLDETTVVEQLLQQIELNPQQLNRVEEYAKQLVANVRKERTKGGGLDAFLAQYDLSSAEGIVLMCLAEALLRVPDSSTVDDLIKDKLTAANWGSHVGKSKSLFVNAATWGLMLTGKILSISEADPKNMIMTFKRLANRSGEPVIRKAVAQAMKVLGRQFVMGRNIEEAVKRAKSNEKKGYRYSYDMLGEAALTRADAERYYKAYDQAIDAIGKISKGLGPIKAPGISVKLSALHPRYEYTKREQMFKELLPLLKKLALKAKEYNINFTVDAEEARRLNISLELIAAIITDPDFAGWDGFGLALQGYQKRAPKVIEWIVPLLRKHNRKIMLRLVKGAYWDSEIKVAQEEGLPDYPVFTRKVNTDLSYLVCAQKLLQADDVIYSQFATHNAYSLAAIVEMAGDRKFEFQCLHGMGDALYDNIVGEGKGKYPCRIYAPVGGHEHLLAYLVRRLLENGANTSFVNRIVDESAPLDDLVKDPMSIIKSFKSIRHPKIPVPANMYGDYRNNSKGINLSNYYEWHPILSAAEKLYSKTYIAEPTIGKDKNANIKTCYAVYDNSIKIGEAYQATEEQVDVAVSKAHAAFREWNAKPVAARAQCLEKMAVLLENNMAELMAILHLEGGKTVTDGVAEIREAVDFCWYYAKQARKIMEPKDLPGPTGETNQLQLTGRGVVACISPWNFPLAIFLGQVVAALSVGNTVIAKPAEQTPLIGAFAIKLLHQAGVPQDAAQLLPGPGRIVGNKLMNDTRIKAVMFTGSTATARHINQTLATRPGAIIPLIAETGGQNCMIVDSTALLEQVVEDVVSSAFHSAGQRCSALRVLMVQEDIADNLISMLQGAMAEIKVGCPMELNVDIGPVIDKNAVDGLLQHARRMEQEAKLVYQVEIDAAKTNKGSFFAPRAFEISSIDLLQEEVFGPVLHIVRYKAKDLDKIIDAIASTGYGLTMGIHSRINDRVRYICERSKVGNIYVNRNMIGAVVGVQPFGGEGLSGTGPKAGGPHYLLRLVNERTITIDTTAAGGNASLMSIGE